MRVRIFQPQCYVPVAVLRVGYAEVVFIQPDRKLDTMWRDAWQRLHVASSYPTWSLQQNGAPSHTTRNTETCSVRTCSSLWAPNCPDLNTVNCHLVCNSADGLPKTTIIKVSPQLTKLREQLSKAWQKLSHGAVIASSSLYHLYVYG